MENNPELEGIVFKIKRYSLHDGPGIRTSVFLKGCQLNCIWCHSPEGITQDISIWYNGNLCIKCNQCIQVCPEKALAVIHGKEQHIHIDRKSCKVSGKCVSTCPSNALQFTGFKRSVSSIISEIEKDIIFYQNSGGGVTLTGGEPLFQPDFSLGILQECRSRRINTAIETSLFCETKVLDLIGDYVDLFIIDLKLFDTDLHNLYTGKGNETIKKNFLYLASHGKNIHVRIPLIDNITNTGANLNAIEEFVRKAGKDIQIEYIAFNTLAENNYKKLGIPYLIK
jgi:pyruvate formate lyase activating enzyme